MLQVINGGRGGINAAYAGGLGQTHYASHTAAGSVTQHDVVTELNHRGYNVAVHVPDPIPAPTTLTKTMAINVAIDEGILKMGLPRTSTHYYRCPSSGCSIDASRWDALVGWVVQVSNGYLTAYYELPSWARQAMHEGRLHGVALSGLRGFSDWLQENSWFVQSVGDTINNYGEFLTAKNVEDAIKANTDKSFTKDDAMALVAALQSGGYVAPGKTSTVAQGASMAAAPGWMMPALIVGGVLVVFLLMKK